MYHSIIQSKCGYRINNIALDTYNLYLLHFYRILQLTLTPNKLVPFRLSH